MKTFYQDYTEWMGMDAMSERVNVSQAHMINVRVVNEVLDGYAVNERRVIEGYYRAKARGDKRPVNARLNIADNDLENLLFGFRKKLARTRGLI